MIRWSIAVSSASLLALACNVGGGGADGLSGGPSGSGPSGPTSASETDTQTGTNTDPSETDPTNSSNTEPSTTNDTEPGDGSSETSEGLPPDGCTAIDLIFVVDNSDDMAEEQLRLQSTANAFVQQMAVDVPAALGAINVGVLPTDDDNFIVAATDPCLAYASTFNYMQLGPTFPAELACALGDVGIGGSADERPMESLINAMSDEQLAPGGFHDGFVRDEALLVIVLVTNEEDDHEEVTQWGSVGDPPDWFDTIVALKGGIKKDVVMLSVVGNEAPNDCADAEPSPRLIEFTTSFKNGLVGDACAQEYASFLNATTATTIANACTEYTIP